VNRRQKTPREIDYIEALGVFYDGWEQRNHAARAKAYQEAMRGVLGAESEGSGSVDIFMRWR